MKRRLIGIGLVLIIAIIVLPMLLSQRQPTNTDTAVKTVTLPTEGDADNASGTQPAQQPSVASTQSGDASLDGSKPLTPAAEQGPPAGASNAPAMVTDAGSGGASASQPASAASGKAPSPSDTTRTARATPPSGSQSSAKSAVPSKPAQAASQPPGDTTSVPAKAPPDTGNASAAIPGQPIGPGDWGVQVGSFSEGRNAEAVAKQLRNKGYRVFVAKARVGDLTVHRVRVGAFKAQDQAQRTASKISDQIGHAVQVLHVR